MQNPYSEDQLIEQPAISILENIGWYTQNCINEFQSDYQINNRQSKSEVVLTDRLKEAFRGNNG